MNSSKPSSSQERSKSKHGVQDRRQIPIHRVRHQLGDDTPTHNSNEETLQLYTAYTLPATEVERNYPARLTIDEATSKDLSPPIRDHQQVHTGATPVTCGDTQVTPPISYSQIPRPWQETNNTAYMDITNFAGASPMERWEREVSRDQMWDNVAGVYVGRGTGSVQSQGWNEEARRWSEEAQADSTEDQGQSDECRAWTMDKWNRKG
jgi:hypothetical protein